MTFAINLPTLKWDKKGLTDFMLSHHPSKWVHERHRNMPNIKYVNKYLRTDHTPLFDEIYNQLQGLELKLEFTFFMELSPKVLLAPHKDAGRNATINFPLLGDWGKTPVRFHKVHSMLEKDIEYIHHYNQECPSVINTSILHSVYNPTSSTRYMLSMSVHKSWEEIEKICGYGASGNTRPCQG